MTKKRIVMAFGTFDLFHPWHEYYLQEARKNGDYLITVIARDTTIMTVKNRVPHDLESLRKKHVEESGLSDEVVFGSFDDPYAVISEKKPDILCFGYDQKSFNNEELNLYLSKNNLSVKTVVLPAFEPEKWKSSKLRDQS